MDNSINMHADKRLRRHCRFSAFLGLGIWITAVALLPRNEFWMITALLLFVPLVLIRLGFAFLIPHGPVRHHRWWYVVSYSQLPAAIALTGSFFVQAHDWAMLLATPWLLFTLMLAGLAIEQLARQPRPKIEEWGRLGAMLFLPIGACWAIAARGHLQPLGFREIIVLLTAVHFHYAGFAIPLMAGELARARPSRWTRGLLLAILIGVPLVAIGITTTQLGGPREIELLSAFVLAGAGIVLGCGQIKLATQNPLLVSGFLTVSGLSLIVALGWSVVYASGQYGLIERVEIPFMVHWHGAINAAGAALCGLFGWHLVLTRKTSSEVA